MFIPQAFVRLEIMNEGTKILGDRKEVGAVPLIVDQASQPLAAEQRSHACDPSAPAQMRNQHRDKGHHHADDRKQIEEVPLRVAASALNPAHVLDEHEAPPCATIPLDSDRRDMDSPLSQSQ